jgi:DNA (cytosine-5)-methyltransferase 1
MSSSNPSRGKRQTPKAKLLEGKNRLLLEISPIARALRPRIIVVENVRQLLTLTVTHNGAERRAVELLRSKLRGYTVFEGVVNVADYGVPQDRRRALE